MKIGTIVTATDTNPLYCDFIPMFVEAWKCLFPECDVCVLLIGDTLPKHLEKCKESIRLIEPIPGMHPAFQSQCIRLLYPQLIERDEGVLITDMDMIPLNRRYYEEPIRDMSDDTFVTYRDNSYPHELYMCYNVAHPKIWKEMFAGESLEKWYTREYYDGNPGGSGWNIDQRVLTEKFDAYQGKKMILNDKQTRYYRLCRSDTKAFYNVTQLELNIRKGIYSDYHCLRPYSVHKELNDFIVECLYSGIPQKTSVRSDGSKATTCS
jgi:hypothetical protein